MERGKIEHETKRGKMDFCLGGTQDEGESKVLPPSRRHKVLETERIWTYTQCEHVPLLAQIVTSRSYRVVCI